MLLERDLISKMGVHTCWAMICIDWGEEIAIFSVSLYIN